MTSLQYLNLQIVFNQMTASKSVFCRTVVITKREKILLLEIYCLKSVYSGAMCARFVQYNT